jgi:multidrug efflux pump subunit AcrA (membrane-fusion protein)
VTAKVQHGVLEAPGFPGDLGGDPDVPDADPRAVVGVAGVVEALQPPGIDGRIVRILLEETTDRVVGDHAAQIDDRRADQAAIDLATVREGGHVAGRRLQPADELALQLAAAEVVQVLQSHGRVLQDLGGLERRDLVEEPPARRVHEQAIPLHLEQPPCLYLGNRVQ